MKISACIITKNEQNNISKCLESYKNIVDEIILVDTGSTDCTVDIAKQYGAKIYYYQWKNDFAAAKNFAIDRAKNPWIIFLDADEYFDPISIQRLPEILKKVDINKHNAIGCKIVNIDIDMDNKVIDCFMNVRVFINYKHIRYRSNVHEGLYNKKGGIHVLALYDELTIYHTGYSSSIVKKKAERNLEILLENIEKNGAEPRHYRYLSDCYLSVGDYDKCIEYARLHNASEIRIPGYESKTYKNIIDALYLKKASKSEIETEIKKAIDTFPEHPNFYYVYGFFLFDSKRYEEALFSLLKAEELNLIYKGIEVNFAAGMFRDIYANIGCLYQLKNQEDKAFEYYLLSLKLDRKNTLVFNDFFKLIKDASTEEVIGVLNAIYNINIEQDIAFLVDELKKEKAGAVFAYYVNIWKNRFHKEDNSLAFLLLAMGKYESALNIFFTGASQDPNDKANCILAAVSAVASEKDVLIEKLLKSFDSSLCKILLNYCGGEAALTPDEWDDYLQLLCEITLLNKPQVLKRYINIALTYAPDLLFRAAMILQDRKLYEQAIMLFENHLSRNMSSNDSAETFMGLGYCHYKLRRYSQARYYFKQAVAHGYSKHDVGEFLEWISERQ